MIRPASLAAAATAAALLAAGPAGAGATVSSSAEAPAAPPGLAAAASDPDVWTPDELARTPPPGPNPWLAYLPAGAEPDWSYWRAWADWRSGLRRAARAGEADGPPPEVAEAEPPGITEQNDLPLLAEPLSGIGSRAGESSTVLVRGALREPPAPLPASVEPDDSIPAAQPLALVAGELFAAPGFVGDGTGGGLADTDFYAFDGLAGQVFEVAVTTPLPLDDLDPIVAVFDAAGDLVDLNDNRGGSGLLTTLDSYLAVTLPADGTYFVAVGGFNPGNGIDPRDMFPSDPFDPGTAPPAGSEGIYEVAFALAAPDPGDLDWFAIELRAGDAVGAVVRGGALRVALADPRGETRVASLRDLTGVYPESSPLPGGGEAALAYVADQAGTWAVGVDRAASFEDAAWELELTVLRPPLDRLPAPARQVVFVDFDGAVLDAGDLGGPPGLVALSPLAAFLGGWGLGPADQDAVIDRVLAAVADNLDLDLRAGGLNGDFEATGRFGEFDVELQNSRDHADPWGLPWVSRVVVGGTRAELGVPTIGIAQSIDVGDFAGEETAVVLLDLLSAPAPGVDSLNSIPRAPGVPIEELVGVALGNLVAHEAGHFLANFHTERDVGTPTLMDRGGRLAVLIGLGEDGVYGSGDDLDVDFGDDLYSFAEGFAGTENTLQAISFGLPAAGPRPEIALVPRGLDFGALDPAASAERTLSVSNEGTATLTVGAAAIGGPDADRFELFEPPLGGPAPFTLAPGGRREVGVRFTPGGIGRRDAVLTLTSDDPAAPAASAPLAGQGGLPGIVLSPLEHDFGDLVYGDVETHLDHPFTIANPGAGPLTVSAFAFTGPDRGAFRVLGPGTATVPAGGAREVTVRYLPGGLVGPMSATLAALSNDPAAPRTDAALAGRALGPDLAISPPIPFSFPSARREAVRERTFTVANLGLLDLQVTAGTLGGDDPRAFEVVSGGPPFTVAPGAEQEMVLAFSPIRLGGHRAELTLASNDPDEDPLVMVLLGEGVQPMLDSRPDSHRFTASPGGEPMRRFFRVSNAGSASLTVEVTEPAGPDAGAFTVDQGGAPFTLAAGGERLVRVVFHPERTGLHQATLRVVSTDPVRPEVHLGLVGNGF